MNKETSPDLRFPQFCDNWCAKIFRSIFRFGSNNSFSKDQLNYSKGKVLNIHYGQIHSKLPSLVNIEKEALPFINENIDLNRFKSNDFISNGDVIFADASEDYNDIGKAIEVFNISNEKILAGLHTHSAKPKKEFALGFFANLFQSWKTRKQIMMIAQGTKVLGISKKQLEKIVLDIPSLPEQQKIAAFLTSVDKKIQQLTRKKELLEKYKKGLMQKIFSQEIRFKDDNGNDFPEWEEKKLLELCDNGLCNGVFNDPKLVGKGYKLINVKDMYSENFIEENQLTLVDISEKEFKKNAVKHGDIFFTRSSLVKEGIAHSNIWLDSSTDVTFDGHLIKMTPNTNIVFPIFLIFYLKSANLRRKLVSRGKTTTMTTIGQEDIAGIPLLLPDIEEQKKIAAIFVSISEKIQKTQLQLTRTKEFKKGLLQQMFV